jgi:transposase-like protein
MSLWEEKTISEIAQETGAHPNLISKWKQELIDNADSAFRNGKSEKEKKLEEEKEELYKQLVKAHAANEFLKKT